MKIAVVLFNLGGPDSLDAVEPFLFNLFYDPAIIRLPKLFRYLLAKKISSSRAPITKEIYRQIGNKSPLLELTGQQAEALEIRLNTDSSNQYKTFIAMRYWHPFANETARQVNQFIPDKIILLPLYPQFSTATSASSFEDWHKAAKNIGMNIPTITIGCYPDEPSFIEAHAEWLLETILKIPEKIPTRILFSAHGLPEKIIRSGDPYQWQVEQTVAHAMAALQIKQAANGQEASVDHAICYQSRVGRLKWIGPSTESEIARAGAEGKAVIIIPIAFISEHSETLVELDIEYKHLAEKAGVKHYLRVPALGVHPLFIASLKQLCIHATSQKTGTVVNHTNKKMCPKEFSECVCSDA